MYPTKMMTVIRLDSKFAAWLYGEQLMLRISPPLVDASRPLLLLSLLLLALILWRKVDSFLPCRQLSSPFPSVPVVSLLGCFISHIFLWRRRLKSTDEGKTTLYTILQLIDTR